VGRRQSQEDGDNDQNAAGTVIYLLTLEVAFRSPFKETITGVKVIEKTEDADNRRLRKTSSTVPACLEKT